jgi:hypothetical protein
MNGKKTRSLCDLCGRRVAGITGANGRSRQLVESRFARNRLSRDMLSNNRIGGDRVGRCWLSRFCLTKMVEGGHELGKDLTVFELHEVEVLGAVGLFLAGKSDTMVLQIGGLRQANVSDLVRSGLKMAQRHRKPNVERSKC